VSHSFRFALGNMITKVSPTPPSHSFCFASENVTPKNYNFSNLHLSTNLVNDKIWSSFFKACRGVGDSVPKVLKSFDFSSFELKIFYLLFSPVPNSFLQNCRTLYRSRREGLLYCNRLLPSLGCSDGLGRCGGNCLRCS